MLSQVEYENLSYLFTKGDLYVRIKLYCDGAASKIMEKKVLLVVGRFAIIKDGEVIYSESGKQIGATNQMMELQAMITGCKRAKLFQYRENIPINVYSDSAYIINCFNQNWWCNWEKNNWLNSKKEPVANRELWEQLIPFFKDIFFTFNKVKGHMGDKHNEYVDKLAVQARLS